jgi:hypothetical protein
VKNRRERGKRLRTAVGKRGGGKRKDNKRKCESGRRGKIRGKERKGGGEREKGGKREKSKG